MKKLYRGILLLIMLSFVVTAVLLLFTPDTVPMHYNAAGEADRYGSKYEFFLFPGISAATALLLLLAKKQGEAGEAQNEKVLLLTGLITLLFLGGMGVYFQWKAGGYDSAGGAAFTDIGKLSNMVSGAVLILLGNVMPKVRRNGLFGLRTKWSMADDDCWQQSQRFGGISAVAAGLTLMLLTLLLPAEWALWLLCGLMLLWAAVSVWGSYRIYRRVRKGK